MESLEYQLEKAQEKFEDLRQEYEEYAYIVCHDLRAPFRHVEGFAQMVLEDNKDVLSEKSLKHLNLVRQSGIKGGSLLDGLLAYSRLHSKALDFHDVDCNAVFLKVQRELAALIKNTGADISCEPLPVISADSGQVELLFYHVLKNALTYNYNRPVIRVGCAKKGRLWEFTVTDNGIGIQQKMAKNVFKPLRRATLDEAFSSEGVGMGLALAKKIVRRHGGDIGYQSEEEGVRFIFSIDSGPES